MWCAEWIFSLFDRWYDGQRVYYYVWYVYGDWIDCAYLDKWRYCRRNGLSGLYDYRAGILGGCAYIGGHIHCVCIFNLFILNKTKFGRITYCLGINDEGNPAFRDQDQKEPDFGVYHGWIYGCLRRNTVMFTREKRVARAGSGYELDAIAAVVLGGTRMGGGAGGAEKTLIGVIIMGVLANALNVMGVTSYPQMIVRGIIIMVAVLMDLRSTKVEMKCSLELPEVTDMMDKIKLFCKKRMVILCIGA